jgi:membrane protease YdiL (CAAX protease family)
VSLSDIPWDFTVILTLLGVIVPWRGAVRVRRLLAQPTLSTSQKLSLYASTIAFQWFSVAVIYWRSMARHLSLNDLGLKVSAASNTLAFAIVFTILLCLNQRAGLRKMARALADRRGLTDRPSFQFQFTQKILPRTSMEEAAFVALALTAGISEEFIYRGFVFALFSRAFGQSGVAILVATASSSIWFAVAHLYQGRRGVTTTFAVGLLFSAARVLSGNLIPAIVAHIGIDLVAGLYAPGVLGRKPGPEVPEGPHGTGG